MKTRNLAIALIGFCLLVALSRASDADPAKAESFNVPGHGDLLLSLPDGWTQKMQEPRPPGMPPTILVSSKETRGRASCEVLITPTTGRDPKFNSPDALKRLAETRGKPMLSTSKEQTLNVQQFKGDSANGSYFTLTDKAPGPGEFENMTACFVGVGDLLLATTILHHQKDAPELKLALDMLKGAKQAPKSNDAANAGPLKIAAPGAKWELVLAGGLKVLDDQTNAARKIRQVMAENDDTGMIVSVFMEPAPNRGDNAAVRTAYWSKAKNSPIPKSNIKQGTSGEYATVEYMVPDVHQKNMNVYIAHEGVWLDIHLSKIDFAEADQARFDEIVKSIKFEPTAAK